MILTRIWHPSSWKKLLRMTCLIIFLASSFSMNAQKVPFEVRNFLLDFEKVVDLSEFDTAILSNRFSTNAAEKFTNFFINKEILIYNDIAQVKGIPLYINPSEYVKEVSELYPSGLSVNITGTSILDVKEYSTYSLYVVEIEKTIQIDNMLENRPDVKFQSPVRLIFYIIRYNNTSVIKIIGVEAAGTAVNNKNTYNRFQPDRIEFNYHYNAYKLNFKDIPEEYAGQETSGHQNRFGILVDWDLNGRKSFTYGLSAGVFYDKTNFSTGLSKYTDRPIPMYDKDNCPYHKIISGTDIDQDNSMSQLTVPVYFNMKWELPSRWKSPDIKQSSANALAYKRGINFNFRIGPHFQYHLSEANDPYTGTFSYGGLYRFYNPVTQDSSSVLIDDLPDYGFKSDTSFSSSNSNLTYTKFNFGISTQLNISIPIVKYLEFYVGPSLFFNFSNVAETGNDFVLSREIGENNSLASSSKTTSVSYGINAGLILDLHAPRVPYSSVDLPEKAKTQFKAKTAYTLNKGSLMKMALDVNLRNEPGVQMIKKVRIPYEISADWKKNATKGKFSGNKTRILKYDYPQSVSNLNFKSYLIIKKPFGYDVKCNDSIALNSVNQPTLTIPLENLNSLVRNRQSLDLTVIKLPTFNFIYVSLYNKNETMEQRKSIVNLVRQIGNEAIYNQEELVVYLSSEAQKPIAYCNFMSGADLPDNIVTDWDRFLYKLEEEYNSQDLIYEDDIKNIDQILNPILNLDERANAERRYVKYSFIVNESEKYYGYDPEIQSDIRSLIYFISNKYCAKIPFKSDQYSFNVYLTEKYKNERKSPSDININIEHLNK
jgi:hypothetical protein